MPKELLQRRRQPKQGKRYFTFVLSQPCIDSQTSAAAEKKEKALPAPKQPTFSFGDLIADLNKPKEPVVAKPAEDRPPETEEERKKRLRKEERRKLRVSWKPDHCLTEVRLFTHDPEEELGPSDGMRREVGDVKGEGSVLKLHRDLDDEDDEEDVGARESELLPYHEPLGSFYPRHVGLFSSLANCFKKPISAK